MKKKLLIIISSVMTLTLVFCAAFFSGAESEPAFIIKSVSRNDTLIVRVLIPGGIKAAGGSYTLYYNPDKLTLESGKTSQDYVTLNNEYTESSVRAAAASAEKIKTNTVMAVYRFSVNSELSDGDFGITDYKLYDVNGRLISSQISRGDVNGDGKISVIDAKLILENVVGLTDFSEEQLSQADLNGDGKITVYDAKLVLRMIADESYYSAA